MAKSPRTAAPCSACSTVLINDGALPSPIDTHPLPPLSEIIGALCGVDGALAGLRELLDAADGTRVHAAHIAALLDPVHSQLSQACNELVDLPLLELSEGMRPMRADEVLLSAPEKLTYKFYEISGKTAFECENRDGAGYTLYRCHTPNNRLDWHPSHWVGMEQRHDTHGRRWSMSSAIYITDDFGTLVPLEGGAL